MTKWKLVPVEPTELQWGGLARDIFMAWDTGCRTPRDLFAHLDMVMQPIPQWLRDEPEMKNLDHVPSKGTRAAIIYRAMLEDAPAPAELSADVVRDAERYRELRSCHWDSSDLAVVCHPKRNVLLGAMCPSGDLLDQLLDAKLAAKKGGAG